MMSNMISFKKINMNSFKKLVIYRLKLEINFTKNLMIFI